MTVDQAIKKLLNLAESQIGYTEPYGDNGNKYAQEMDTIWAGWFNTKKNHGDWCAIFAGAWLFLKSFGWDTAAKMVNHDCEFGKLTAVVQYLYRSLMLVDRVGKDPHPGDIIFYHNDKYSGFSQLCHVGIVWKVEGDYVVTIEGNSGPNNTQVATRRIRKDYDTKSWGVYGFGYPDYAAAADIPSKYPDTPFEVEAVKAVDIRKGPYSDTEIIGKMKAGEKAQITSCEGSTSDFGRMDRGYIYLAQDSIKIEGAPRNEWVKDGGKWYFYDAEGHMVKSEWVKWKTRWYYLGHDGAMLIGWQTIQGKKYYLYEKDGHMAAYEWIDDLWLEKYGEQIYPYKGEWHENKVGKWYEDTSGWYPKDCEMRINKVKYRFDKKGYLIK